jgi:hypothetical protein
MTALQPTKPPSPLSELARLIEPSTLGYFTHFEATEVFALQKGQDGATNVFTLLVAEERQSTNKVDSAPRYLNSKPLRINRLPGWAFGVRRYRRPISDLLPALEAMEAGQAWKSCGDPLRTGLLTPMPFQFVPPDNSGTVPMNRLLKNNFWNGSHLFEWSDREKAALKLLFDQPPLLQALTEKIQTYLPMSLAAVSDRLGNLLVQLPVSVLIAQFNRLRPSGDFEVEVAWHPKAAPRPLRVACELEYDGLVSGYAQAPMNGLAASLPMRSGRGLHRGFVWDDENEVVLAATGPGAFIGSVALDMQTPDPEPRVFKIKRADGPTEERRAGLIGHATQNLVGDAHPDDNGGWTQRRIYKERAGKLAEERLFVQYRPEPAQRAASHKKALGDLRRLIAQYGKAGAWLWDPFLSVRDILETLFYCPHPGADLRALTSADAGRLEELRRESGEVESNWRNLRLEYRIQRNVGWDFHDRFLIFPSGGDAGALAWSLGTSVNSVGKAHHILQQVDNGQLVMDAFVELWNLLSGPDQLIWKKP